MYCITFNQLENCKYPYQMTDLTEKLAAVRLTFV